MAEQDYDALNEVLAQFRAGAPVLWLKRMGRKEWERWYEPKDVADVDVLLLEWTHAGSADLKNTNLKVFFNSTPEETRACRVARSRDAGADSLFVTMVLEIEQAMLNRRACDADLIQTGTHDGRHGSLRLLHKGGEHGGKCGKKDELSLTPMLNAYPDSLGGTLSDIADLLESSCKDAFGAFYILPSVFNTDLDRGFSVVDYSLNELLATPQDLERIRALGVQLKLDFILNHASVLSPQFQDLLKNGEASKYKDFFIDWNAFWAGCGEMMPGGYIQPAPEYLHKMFFRKPGLPILMVRMPDGTEKPYWNTFYQQVDYPCPDARELVSELGMQYRSACVLTESLRIQLAAGKRPAELDLGRWETLRVPLTDLLESRRRYLGRWI